MIYTSNTRNFDHIMRLAKRILPKARFDSTEKDMA